MKRMLSAFLTSMLLGMTIPGMAQPQPQASQPTAVMAETATKQATIEDIDKEKRLVTLKDSEGNTIKLHIGKRAQHFDKLQKGDIVTANFYTSAAVRLAKPGEEPTGAEQTMFMVKPENGQPGGTMVDTIKATATVQDINTQTREVTLKDADGKTISLKVDPSVQNLGRIKKGDQIVVRYTEAAAISVAKPQQ
jgi:hypothetical protein